MAEAAGKVSIEETDKALKVIVTESSGEEHSYSFPPRTRLHVADGEKVEVGQQLNEGSLYPADLLAIRGRTDVELYLVAEVQKVYRAQGVDINDKHIELIARQMLKKVRIESKGSTSLLPGPARGPRQPQTAQQEDQGRRRHAGQRRGGHPRDHQGLAGDRVLPLRRLLPGDDQGAHRRCPRGQTRPPGRPQGERDHRQADPGRDRPQALPHGRGRAGRADRAAERGGPARRGRAGGRARGRRRRGAGRGLRPLLRGGARGARAGDRADLGGEVAGQSEQRGEGPGCPSRSLGFPPAARRRRGSVRAENETLLRSSPARA